MKFFIPSILFISAANAASLVNSTESAVNSTVNNDPGTKTVDTANNIQESKSGDLHYGAGNVGRIIVSKKIFQYYYFSDS